MLSPFHLALIKTAEHGAGTVRMMCREITPACSIRLTWLTQLSKPCHKLSLLQSIAPAIEPGTSILQVYANSQSMSKAFYASRNRGTNGNVIG